MFPKRLFLLLLCVISVARAHDFPAIYNSESDGDAAPMPAEQAAASFDVDEKFRVRVVAQEPQVQNPIAMTWDARGRIWVAENYTYAERSQKFDLSLRDRVIILEDQDGDGKTESRKVFTDQVQMLTSVEVGHGGVWLMCPPNLLYIPDKNHDDQPDSPGEIVLDGFEVAKENYHNFANGLRWGPDGWLYGRCGGSCPGRVGRPGTPLEDRVALEGGIWRYHPTTKHFEVLTHGTCNPWGHDWNSMGQGFFINTVNGHLWHLIPGAHFKRPFTLDPNPHVYELIDLHADHWHFDTEGSWTKSRDGAANAFGGGHAHTGMSIYLGGTWPSQYTDRLMTINIHGQRINQEILNKSGSGYVATHGPDTMIAKDPFFRGMDLSYGPDGNVYVIDWSDTGECHEHTGVHRTSGRIYCLEYTGDGEIPSGRSRNLRDLTDFQLASLIGHKNEWFVRQARLVLSERCAAGNPCESAVTLLRRMLDQRDPQQTYRALVSLHSMGKTDEQTLLRLLDHENADVRAWSIRLLFDDYPIDDVFGPIVNPDKDQQQERYRRLRQRLMKAAREDTAGIVQLTLASTLQRLGFEGRVEIAEALMQHSMYAEDHNLPLMVWYGLMPVATNRSQLLAPTAIQSRWPKTQRMIVRRLAEQIDEKPEPIASLVAHATQASSQVQSNILLGIAEGLRGWSRAKEPRGWSELVKANSQEADPEVQTIIRDLSVLFGDGRALADVRKIVTDPKAEVGLRQSALETLIASKDAHVLEICLPLLEDRQLNVVAIKGVGRSNDPEVAEKLIKSYRRFRAPHRPKVIEVLASRSVFAKVLLDAVEEQKVPLSDLTAFDIRQIRSLGDQTLQQRAASLWGQVRDSSPAKKERITHLKQQLTAEALAGADPVHGRRLFNKSCSQCHRLYGVGETIGPDLTGANRNNLDYLLDNIVDPSAVVSKDYRMTIVVTVDGQVLNGLVANRNDKTLTLQTQTDRKTIALEEIDEIRRTPQSPMPDGLLDNLSMEEIESLISYLMAPTQVALPNN